MSSANGTKASQRKNDWLASKNWSRSLSPCALGVPSPNRLSPLRLILGKPKYAHSFHQILFRSVVQNLSEGGGHPSSFLDCFNINRALAAPHLSLSSLLNIVSHQATPNRLMVAHKNKLVA